MIIRSLAVFCGAKKGINPRYAEDAMIVGELMAKHNLHLVFGGGNAGLMASLQTV
jgi:predicted Rossmann-fold nucleotide-binding protein